MNRRFAKTWKTCSVKYKTRKILEIFYKNRVYRFAILDFCTFGLFFKMLVRKCKHINRACICTSEHIKIKSIGSFEESAVRKKRNSLVAAKPHKKENFRNIFYYAASPLRKELTFSIFGLFSRILVRKCKHINMACIYTLEHIRIKRIGSFDESAVRKNLKNLFGKVQN